MTLYRNTELKGKKTNIEKGKDKEHWLFQWTIMSCKVDHKSKSKIMTTEAQNTGRNGIKGVKLLKEAGMEKWQMCQLKGDSNIQNMHSTVPRQYKCKKT